MDFNATRLSVTHELVVPAFVEQVFPLLCPKRELEWLPGWSCEMIFSSSGGAEPGCVFRTHHHGREGLIWVVTMYQPPTRIQYTILKPDSHVWNMDISLAVPEEGGAAITWQHTYTALTEEGNEFLADYSEDDHREYLARLERALVHFLEHGTILEE
jgi:hypothetical protein